MVISSCRFCFCLLTHCYVLALVMGLWPVSGLLSHISGLLPNMWYYTHAAEETQHLFLGLQICAGKLVKVPAMRSICTFLYVFRIFLM